MLRVLFPLLLLTFVNLAVAQAPEDKSSYDSIFKAQILKNAAKLAKLNITPQKERSSAYWKNVGQQELKRNLKKQNLNTNRAKNIIFFMGDGMSLSTVTAARILQGQRNGKRGEEEQLSFEKFPFTGLSKTYCTNAQVADSACSATAYFSGVKGNMLTVGVNGNVNFNNCTQSNDPDNQVSTIAAWAQKAGKSTGFVTTTTLTHASPSGSYAHAPNRLFESDTDVEANGADPAECMDIATQLVTQEPGKNFNILMGGGMSKFLPNDIRDAHGNLGIRKDGKNLLATWEKMHPQGVIVTSRDQLLNLDISNVTNIMGVFQSKYMDYHLKADPAKQPTLTEMTEAAIKLMERNPNGYFLFVEGGLIDTAHHGTRAALALDETVEMAKAVERAREITREEDTLIITTSDHGHPLTITGYPIRGNPILGTVPYLPDAVGLKYLTLNYAMGPHQYLDSNGTRLNLDTLKIDTDFQYPGYIKGTDSRHSGEDVAIYASGPFAHLFSGVIEENTIAHLMAYAACVGDGLTMCGEWGFLPYGSTVPFN